MNSEREKADILFNYGLPLQFCCHLIQFYTVLSLRTATLNKPLMYMYLSIRNTVNLALNWNLASVEDIQKASILNLLP